MLPITQLLRDILAKIQVPVGALVDYLKSTKDDWNYILPSELKKELENEKDYYIIDLRRKEDYDQGHIPGAHNIFWLDILNPENLEKIPRDKKIIVYCYVGHTSSQAMVLLRLLGFDVTSLKFGMGISPSADVPIAGWSTFNYPVVK